VAWAEGRWSSSCRLSPTADPEGNPNPKWVAAVFLHLKNALQWETQTRDPFCLPNERRRTNASSLSTPRICRSLPLSTFFPPPPEDAEAGVTTHSPTGRTSRSCASAHARGTAGIRRPRAVAPVPPPRSSTAVVHVALPAWGLRGERRGELEGKLTSGSARRTVTAAWL